MLKRWLRRRPRGAIQLAGLLLLALTIAGGRRALASAALTPEPFLFPPFPGSASEELIFDHSSPTYSQTDTRIVTSGGLEAHKNCPVPAPAGNSPPQDGVCDAGYGIYWSYRSCGLDCVQRPRRHRLRDQLSPTVCRRRFGSRHVRGLVGPAEPHDGAGNLRQAAPLQWVHHVVRPHERDRGASVLPRWMFECASRRDDRIQRQYGQLHGPAPALPTHVARGRIDRPIWLDWERWRSVAV